MLRSLYSGISGMKNFQTKLDVIGNNIANVNTYGFKKSRTTFSDLVNQQLAGAAGATYSTAGTNPQQVGLGSSISSIDTIHTTGSMQTTSRTLDLALAGDGFFVVGTIKDADAVGLDTDTTMGDNLIDDATAIDDAIELGYTRTGNFYLDDKGYLVTADGLYLIGEAGEKIDPNTYGTTPFGKAGLIQIPLTAQSFSISQDGTVSFVNEAGDLNVAGQIRLANFANDGGLEKVGGNLYRETSNAGTLVGNPDEGLRLNDLSIAGENGTSTMVSGALEMSNVDLTEEFTDMIVAQRGFQSNTKIITTSDEVLQEIMGLKR